MVFSEKTAISEGIQKTIKIWKYISFFLFSKKINKVIPEIKKIFFWKKNSIMQRNYKDLWRIYEKNVDELELFEIVPKGELTVVISENKIIKNISKKLSESDKNMIKKMVNKFSTREITDLISENKNISKKEIYNFCLNIKNESKL